MNYFNPLSWLMLLGGMAAFLGGCQTNINLQANEEQDCEGSIYSLYECEYRGETCSILWDEEEETALYVRNYEKVKELLSEEGSPLTVEAEYDAPEIYTQDIKCQCNGRGNGPKAATKPVEITCLIPK